MSELKDALQDLQDINKQQQEEALTDKTRISQLKLEVCLWEEREALASKALVDAQNQVKDLESALATMTKYRDISLQQYHQALTALGESELNAQKRTPSVRAPVIVLCILFLLACLALGLQQSFSATRLAASNETTASYAQAHARCQGKLAETRASIEEHKTALKRVYSISSSTIIQLNECETLLSIATIDRDKMKKKTKKHNKMKPKRPPKIGKCDPQGDPLGCLTHPKKEIDI